MKAFFICLLGLVIVLFLFWLIRFLLAPKRSFSDFFVGDIGTYSLSRLQAVLWAIIIISYQVSTLIVTIMVTNITTFKDFNLVFSKEVMWLLGLSLGSYVVVKGITVGKISSGQVIPVKANLNKKLSDLVMSDEGLDFSRFQMLIWTIFAILVFITSYYHYIYLILKDDGANLKTYFPGFDDDKKILPTVDMSLIVLMGLSQGAYIGRKLVPDNRVAEYTQEYLQDIETREYGLSFQESQLRLMLLSPEITPDKKFELQSKLNDILNKKNNLATEKTSVADSVKNG